MSIASADAIDTAAINGSGSSNQPTGILNTSGIGSVAGGTNGASPTLDHLLDLKKEIAFDNADVATCGFLTNAKVESVLGKLSKNRFDLGVREETARCNISVIKSDLFFEIQQMIQRWRGTIGSASNTSDS